MPLGIRQELKCLAITLVFPRRAPTIPRYLGITFPFIRRDAMNHLRYWSFPVTDGKAAVLVTTASHTEIALIDLQALPHFLAQLESARSFTERVVFHD
jgi:hypothetical protein